MNDRRILNMWKKLDSAKRLQMAGSCKRFRKIFETYDIPQYVIFKMESLNPMSFREIDLLTRIVGPRIEVLSVEESCLNNVRFKKFFTIFLNNCTRLRCIMFKSVKLPFSSYELFMKAANLSELHLPDCKLTDKDVEFITMLPNLIVLNLSKNDEITGFGLPVLRNLKGLHLAFCSSLEPRYLVQMLKSMQSLKVLDIQQNYTNRRISLIYDEFGYHCRTLEKLRITLPENIRYDCLARLRKLKTVCAFGYVRRFITDLRNHKSKLLEALHLESLEEIPLDTTFILTQFRELHKLSCTGEFIFNIGCVEGFESLKKLAYLSLYQPDALTQKAVFVLLRKCPKLRYLFLSFKENANETFIYELIAALEQRPVQMLLVLNLQQSSIPQSIVEEPRCVAAKSFLQITFEQPQFEWDGRL